MLFAVQHAASLHGRHLTSTPRTPRWVFDAVPRAGWPRAGGRRPARCEPIRPHPGNVRQYPFIEHSGMPAGAGIATCPRQNITRRTISRIQARQHPAEARDEYAGCSGSAATRHACAGTQDGRGGDPSSEDSLRPPSLVLRCGIATRRSQHILAVLTPPHSAGRFDR